MTDPKLAMPKVICPICKGLLRLILCACGACSTCHPIGSGGTCPQAAKRA